MTAEELWEKKEIIGCVLVLLIFVGGLGAFRMMRSGPGDKAIATLVQTKRVGDASLAYDVGVFTTKNAPLFRERIVSPKDKLERITEKKPGQYFQVTYETTTAGAKILTSIGKTIPAPEEK